MSLAVDVLLKQHARWLESGEGRPADFSGMNLTGLSFSGLDLSEAKFIRAILDRANFSGAKLVGTDFSGASLIKTNFSKAVCLEAKFFGAILFVADISDADFAEVDLTETDCPGAKFYRSNLAGACLLRANCYQANFRETNLSRIDARRADFTRATFMKVKATKADFTGANFESATLRQVNFRSAILFEARLAKADIRKAKLVAADLTYTNLKQTRFDDVDLTNTVLDPFEAASGAGPEFEEDPERPGNVIGYRAKQQLCMKGPDYEVGKEYTAPVFSTCLETESHPGLYLFPKRNMAERYIEALTGSINGKHLIRVSAPREDVHRVGSFWRCRRFLVLDEIPLFKPISNLHGIF